MKNTPSTLINMTNEFQTARIHFSDPLYQNDKKYSKKLGGVEHTFIRILDINGNERILARLNTIASGNNGKVKLYVDENNQYYAVKTPLPGREAQRDKDFLQEVKSSNPTLAAQGQKQLIGIMENMSSKKHTMQEYIVMEYIEGKDLNKAALLAKYDSTLTPTFISHYPKTAIYKIFYNMLLEMQDLHTSQNKDGFGILHLDLKPENMILFRNGDDFKITITDFGVSEFCKPGQSVTLPSIRGTLAYMAPELKMLYMRYKLGFATPCICSAAVDIFSAGVIGKANFGLDDPIIAQMLADLPEDRPALETIISIIKSKAEQKLTPEEITQIEKLEAINNQGEITFNLATNYINLQHLTKDLSNTEIDDKCKKAISAGKKELLTVLDYLNEVSSSTIDTAKIQETNDKFNSMLITLSKMQQNLIFTINNPVQAQAVAAQVAELKATLTKAMTKFSITPPDLTQTTTATPTDSVTTATETIAADKTLPSENHTLPPPPQATITATLPLSTEPTATVAAPTATDTLPATNTIAVNKTLPSENNTLPPQATIPANTIQANSYEEKQVANKINTIVTRTTENTLQLTANMTAELNHNRNKAEDLANLAIKLAQQALPFIKIAMDLDHKKLPSKIFLRLSKLTKNLAAFCKHFASAVTSIQIKSRLNQLANFFHSMESDNGDYNKKDIQKQIRALKKISSVLLQDIADINKSSDQQKSSYTKYRDALNKKINKNNNKIARLEILEKSDNAKTPTATHTNPKRKTPKQPS